MLILYSSARRLSWRLRKLKSERIRCHWIGISFIVEKLNIIQYSKVNHINFNIFFCIRKWSGNDTYVQEVIKQVHGITTPTSAHLKKKKKIYKTNQSAKLNASYYHTEPTLLFVMSSHIAEGVHQNMAIWYHTIIHL